MVFFACKLLFNEIALKASINKEALKINIKMFYVTISMASGTCWRQVSLGFSMDRFWFPCFRLNEDGQQIS